MEDGKARALRLTQLGFIGKILASFTHELKNHLAIIKESAGLQHDLISFGGKKVKLDPNEMLKFLGSIDQEIQKTLRLATFLNRYAHRMDSEMSLFSVNEALEELVALTERLARQRRIDLVKEFDPEVPQVFSNPSWLELVIFCLVEDMLRSLEQRSTVVFKTGRAGDGVVISLVPRGQRIELDDEKQPLCTEEFIDATIRDLSGTISRGGQGGEIAITLPFSEAPKEA